MVVALTARTLVGYQTSGDSTAPVYCLQCDIGVDANGEPRHPIYHGDEKPKRCARCGKVFDKFEECSKLRGPNRGA